MRLATSLVSHGAYVNEHELYFLYWQNCIKTLAIAPIYIETYLKYTVCMCTVEKMKMSNIIIQNCAGIFIFVSFIAL